MSDDDRKIISVNENDLIWDSNKKNIKNMPSIEVWSPYIRRMYKNIAVSIQDDRTYLFSLETMKRVRDVFSQVIDECESIFGERK